MTAKEATVVVATEEAIEDKSSHWLIGSSSKGEGSNEILTMSPTRVRQGGG